ncbi:hypothetical protein FK498_17870 [Elioraea sp. Yellowstone]|jgi:hypothetical protein|uniref:hypothetical protein n=1 Tax=Elioraea sp. Yellowstone TaxID=2592070 RepID=UPI00114F22A9|nr:hypothetical protein [Elioraea sp. Yellowstone]TQF76424.1 hypothetical protein FK498_17870 [Elioraea sp. Yellowstone]
MIVSILLHAAAGLAAASLLAWLIAQALPVWVAATVWLVAAVAIVVLTLFARGALGPHGGG